MDGLAIILCAWLVSISSGLLGSFLILRRMAMMADAISHAVLPGLVVAYFIAGTREVLPMLLGAAVFGLFASFLIESMGKWLKIQEDAAIGVTYTWLFALGVAMISLFAGDLDIDQDCVLFGALDFITLDTWQIGSLNMGPRALYVSGLLVILVYLFVHVGYKGLVLTSFAEDFALSKGISTAKWHYALMTMVSLNTVLSFEIVGAILVVGLTIIPPATAYMLTTELKKMLGLTVLFGLLAAVGGYFLANWLDVSGASAIVVVAGLNFVMVVAWKKTKPSVLS